MKHLTTTLGILLLLLTAATGYSQNQRSGKPLIFSKLPVTINCSEAQLSSFFTAAKGAKVNVTLANNFSLAGPVVSNQVKYSNLQTIVIRLSSFNDALFSLSKQTDKNNKVTYVGKIMSPSYADGFELKQKTDGTYELNKIDLEKILVNCSQ